MEQHLQAIATLFSLVNPMVCLMMFSASETGQDRATRIRDASLAMAVVAAVLAVAAFAGTPILRAFGISLAAFSVAGGGVLVFIGLSMMRGAGGGTGPAQEDGGNRLARLILFAASPGTITGVMTIVASHSGTAVPVTALVAIAVITLLTWGLLVLSSGAGKARDGRPGLGRQMASRYMGLIIIAMGIQFALEGIKSFMA